MIVTGDAISGYAWDGTPDWSEKLWNAWTKPMRDLSIPWALALGAHQHHVSDGIGNHDAEGDLDEVQMVDLDASHPMSFTDRRISGTANYVIPIGGVEINSSRTEAMLWIFDSGDRDCMGSSGWGCVQPDQIEVLI